VTWPSSVDLATWMGRDAFGGAEEDRARLLLEAAIGVVEETAGQRLTVNTDTLVVDAHGAAALLLPRWPVTNIAAVTERRGGEWRELDPVADYDWSATGTLTRRGCSWPVGDRAVGVTYTAGHDPIPPALARVVLELAARGHANPAGAGGVQIGATNVQWRALGLELTRGQQQIVDHYRARA
jgi:hypothetical protein